MSDLAQGPITLTDGQAPPAPPDGAPQTVNVGQAPSQSSPDPGQANAPGTAEPTFFDINSLPPELMAPYKQMQGAFTKKMQGISTSRQKIDAYDNFTRDPIGSLQAMAKQYGMSLTRAEAKATVEGDSGKSFANWEPQSWQDVINRTKEETREVVLAELAPIIGNVQKLQAGNIEKQLNEIDPAWRQYEDDMRKELQAHPTLVNDVGKLYRLTVPESVLTSKATQAALAKLQQKGEAAKISGTPSTSRSVPAPKKAGSFQEAVEIAKEKCRQEGTYRG